MEVLGVRKGAAYSRKCQDASGDAPEIQFNALDSDEAVVYDISTQLLRWIPTMGE